MTDAIYFCDTYELTPDGVTALELEDFDKASQIWNAIITYASQIEADGIKLDRDGSSFIRLVEKVDD